MIRVLQAYFWPQLVVTIQPNHLSVRHESEQQSFATDAPFSCGHMLVSDIDILEHAASKVFKRLVPRGFWSFPHVLIMTDSRLHWLERKVIRDAMTNAGARRVEFADSIPDCEEATAARSAYIREASAKK
jgi:actin-like ATPase involved in cell morphogenesis